MSELKPPCCRLSQEYLVAIVRNRSGIDSGEIDYNIRLDALEKLVGRDRDNAIHAANEFLRRLGVSRADDAGRLTGAVERIKAMPFMVYTRFLKTGAEEFLPRASVFAALGIAPASPSAEPCGSVGCMGPESKWACSKCKPAHPGEGGL